eukprot:1961736-Prymnesium_polylepis.1
MAWNPATPTSAALLELEEAHAHQLLELGVDKLLEAVHACARPRREARDEVRRGASARHARSRDWAVGAGRWPQARGHARPPWRASGKCRDCGCRGEGVGRWALGVAVPRGVLSLKATHAMGRSSSARVGGARTDERLLAHHPDELDDLLVVLILQPTEQRRAAHVRYY